LLTIWFVKPSFISHLSRRIYSANILATYAKLSATAYNWLAIVPRWLLLVITGTIASTIMNFLHANDQLPKKKTEEVPEWAKEQEAAVTGDTAKGSQIAGAGEKSGVHDVKASQAKASTSSTKKRKGKK
jgi:hypothetical protein